MKEAAILFAFLLILPIANAQLVILDQQHKSEAFSKEITLFERLSGLLSSLMKNNNTIARQEVVSFRKLDALNFTNQMHNSTSNMFSINVTYLTLEELCSDSIQSGDEEGIDCGGSCPNSCSMIAFDLLIESRDILFEKNSAKANIRNNGYRFIHDAEARAVNTDTMENATKIADVRGNGNITVNFNLTINDGDTLLIQLDYNDKINETDEKNNFAFKKFEGFPFVFVSVDLELNKIEEEFISYVKDNLKSSYYTDDENDASVKIYIGKNNLVNKQKSAHTRFNFDYYYDFGNIYYKDKVSNLPYNGLISAYKDNDIINNENIINVLIYGNEIDGTIAAVKEFIDKEADFLNIGNEKSFFIDNENLNAIKIFDFLHNTGNGDNYLLDNNAFKNIVRNALRDEMFIEKDYTVNSVSGVSLRLRNLKPNASDMYLLYLNSTGVPVELPVVLARGLWSNLSSWQVLASELANEGRDAWMIEITGGPGQDCDSCPDYTFDDLTDDYVPSLLDGVLARTGKDRLQYVGFSNGCRATLSSLEKNEFEPSKVESFVGVGCPGAFEGFSIGASLIDQENADKAISKLESSNRTHFTFREAVLARFITPSQSSLDENNKISLNLLKQYLTWINSNNDTQPGNLPIDNFAIIQGTGFITSDGIVTTTDQKAIYDKINLNTPTGNNTNVKRYFSIVGFHFPILVIPSIADTTKTKSLIDKTLNKKPLTLYQKLFELKESETKG